MNDQGIVVIVSGPAGAGKGTICKALVEKYPDEYALSISATSRSPRGTEAEGVEYFFKTRDEFEEMIRLELLLEYASYLDNYYGTPRIWVEEQLLSGINVILEIDIQGGFKVKEKIPEALTVFIMPPSMEELRSRLEGRGTETPAQIEKRLARAQEEMAIAPQYDCVIVNEAVEKSVEMLHTVIKQKKKETLRGDR